MIGLLVLGFAALYVAFWVYVVISSKTRAARITAVVIALAIPFWDVIPGYLYFKHLCSQEGGLHSLAKFPSTLAILVDRNSGYRPDEVFKFGFVTVELERANSVVRYSRQNDKILESTHSAPVSTVAIRSMPHQQLNLSVVRGDVLAVALATDQTIARHTYFTWRGPWWRAGIPLFRFRLDCFANRDTSVLTLVARGSG